MISLPAGVIAYGIDRAGKHARASGWGPAFLDGGSGYDIGGVRASTILIDRTLILSSVASLDA